MSSGQAPAWVREVDFSVVLHPQIMLTGNVRDWYRMPVPPALPPDAAPDEFRAILYGSAADLEWDYVPSAEFSGRSASAVDTRR